MSCDYGKSKGCKIVVCGHIHVPNQSVYKGIEYFNSGDWVENFSSLVLTKENEWKLIKING